MRMHPIMLLLFLIVSTLNAQNNQVDNSLSPYFLVKTTDGQGVESLPLRSTRAEVNIAGVIADVTVRQVYENTGNVAIEAIYVFPGSTRSAVYGMQMKIGERIIEAEIKEKQQAREIYETAKEEGKRASLLEQERPNVFQMNVANILPGDRIEVSLQYTELLIPEGGIYEFIYPTVVGPRYTNGTESRNNGYTAMPYTKMGTAPSYEFGLQIYLDGGMPLQDVSSSTHKIRVSPAEKEAVNIRLLDEESTDGNRDFILRYNFRGNEIQTGMLVFDDGEEQFFLCMAQPPKQILEDQIPAREYIFLMDVSGSMRGFPLSVSKELMKNLIAELRPDDAFNILVFAGGNQWWSEVSVSATADNVRDAENFLNNLRGGGGTSLLPALQRCLEFPRYREELSRSIIVVSDGYVSVEDEAFELVRNNLNKANLFSFGIGSSVNRHLMEGLARAGQGQPFIVTNQKAAEEAAEKLRRYIQYPLFTQITPRFSGGFDAYDIEPSSLPDVMSERPVLLFGKYRGDLNGKITLEGYAMEKTPAKKSWWPFGKTTEATISPKRVQLNFDVSQAQSSERNAAIKYLWAREKIRNISDFTMYDLSEEDKQETIRLGLQYNLLTNFTSFVAVEKEISNDDPNRLVPVKQPLPLPDGVSNSAIGFELNLFGMSGAELLDQGNRNSLLWILLGCLLGIALFFRIRKWNKQILPILLTVISMTALNSCETTQVTTQPFNEVTFILGEDKNPENAYYDTALKYFSTDSLESTALVVQECKSLVEVMDYLWQNPPSTGAWRTINMVVHGNEWTGINLPIVPDGPRCSQRNLVQAIEQNVIEALSDDLIDSSTRLNIVGCNVGKNEALLHTICAAFGGTDEARPTIASSRHFNIFRQEGLEFKRHLAESCFVNFPAGSFPGNKLLAQHLETKYPKYKTDWNKALHTLSPQSPAGPYVHYFSIPAEWVVIYSDETARSRSIENKDALSWVKQQKELMDELGRMKLEAASFSWEVEPIKVQDKPALAAKGYTIIYCILHPFINEEHDYIQPSVNDPAYYAIVR